TGLLYEIVWVRIFGLIFGNTTLALSAVLAAFMMGLAGGGLVLGKIADRHEHPLKLYAWLEAGAGLCALLIPLLRAPMESLFAFIYPQAASQATLFFLLKFIVAFLLMFPATFLMGGTLPVLSRAVIRESSRTGFGIGTLYGVNTLGAMAGCFVTGFVLIRVIGVSNAIYAGVLTNLIIAAGAYLLWRYSVSMRTAPTPERVAEEAPLDHRVKIVLAAVAISGFVALAYEVLWARVLVFVMTNSVYAATVTLTTMLCGIGIGSYVGGRWADRSKRLFAVFGWIEVGIGCGALIAAIMLINLSWIHDRIFTIGPRTSWWTWNGVRFFEAFLVMFLPALLMGASFPVAGKIAVTRLQHISSRLGLVYFFNTLGGVAGSFLTSYFLISALGTSATVTAMVLLNLLLGVYLIQYDRRQLSRRMVVGFAVVGVLVMILGIRATPATLFTVAYSHVEKDFPLIDYREGIEGTVTVHEQIKPFSRTKRIDVDGLNVAGTSFMLKTLQTLQGHIPLCLHPNPQSALQIGFGTGETSKCALRHPLAEFQVAEISKDVLELSDVYFQDLNEGVLKHPKFDYAIVDGKNIVKYAGRYFDVVMNDGNYAVATSSASLFTKDHFENCRDRLRPGGIVSTWMTIDLDPVDFAIVLKTFQSVFPYCALWMAPNCINKQIVLLGSVEPWQIDFQKLSARLAIPAVKQDFAAINIGSVYDFLDCFMLDHRGIAEISAPYPINTDDRPLLEFSTRDIRSRDFCAFINLGAIAARRPWLGEMITNLPDDAAQREKIENNLKRHHEATRLLLAGMVEAYQGKTHASLQTLMAGSKLIPESNLAREYFQRADLLGNELIAAAALDRRNLEAQVNLSRHLIGLARYEEAMKVLNAVEPTYASHPLVQYELARCYLAQGRADSAKTAIQKATAAHPQFVDALFLEGELLSREEAFDRALILYEKILQIDPRMYEAHNAIGRIYRGQDLHSKAIEEFKKSLAIMEFQPAVVEVVGDCHREMNDLKSAISFYQRALQMGGEHANLFFNLGNAFYLNKEFAKASAWYTSALGLDSTNAEIYYNLGNALMMQKKIQEAAAAYAQAVKINDGEPDYFNNLALSHRELGNLAEARRVFERGLALHPNSPMLIENYRSIQKR
ncbi:hypothetical protein DCC62_11640, partial [candidate division KSB1 bacterium]